jgi:8-amino-3,8-dideoxy-alpha-D-manno-octulosonate transaminase
VSNQREKERAALQGSLKAVTRVEGKGEPKIGVDEFLSVAGRFGFSEDTIEEIREVVSKEDGGGGPFLANYYSGLPESKVEEYQRIARELFGSQFAIGVSSGTGALHASFTAVGVGPGTEVICPAIGFFATEAAVVVAGGTPVFCDVDESLCIDPTKIADCITDKTVAVAPTHVSGAVCNMDPIMEVAREHGIAVIEDCAQAFGGTYRDKMIGTFGDAGCFSISAYKIVGGGEGGLIIMDDERIWDRANCLAEGGGLWRPERFAESRYEGELFCGTNYRMSELEAAVDVVQLRKAKDVVDRFRDVKRRITEQLDTFAEITPQLLNDADGEVGYQLRFYPDTIERGEDIVAALQSQNVGASMRGRNGGPDWHVYHSMFPITENPGVGRNDQRGDCPVADDLFDRVINIGLNQWYTDNDCDNVADAINRALAVYCTKDSDAPAWRRSSV